MKTLILASIFIFNSCGQDDSKQTHTTQPVASHYLDPKDSQPDLDPTHGTRVMTAAEYQVFVKKYSEIFKAKYKTGEK